MFSNVAKFPHTLREMPSCSTRQAPDRLAAVQQDTLVTRPNEYAISDQLHPNCRGLTTCNDPSEPKRFTSHRLRRGKTRRNLYKLLHELARRVSLHVACAIIKGLSGKVSPTLFDITTAFMV